MTNHERLHDALLEGRDEDVWTEYLWLHSTGEADAQVHHLGGRAALARGNPYAARTCMERALAAGASGRTLGQVRLILGEVQRRIGELNGAAETLEGFLAGMFEYPELGALWQATALRNLGLTYRQLGRLGDARSALSAAAEEFRREGLEDLLRMTLQNLAWVDCLLGQFTEAREALNESSGYCQGEDAIWHQRVNQAFLEAETGWLSATTAACTAIIEPSSGAPMEVVAQAYWLLGREALRLQDLNTAYTLAEVAINTAMMFPGDNRVLLDAAELHRRVLLQMKEKETTAGA